MKMFSANVKTRPYIPDIHSPIGLKMNLYASTLLSCKENLELKTIVFSIAESVGFYSLDYIL